jgi:hypothetical protein
VGNAGILTSSSQKDCFKPNRPWQATIKWGAYSWFVMHGGGRRRQNASIGGNNDG